MVTKKKIKKTPEEILEARVDDAKADLALLMGDSEVATPDTVKTNGNDPVDVALLIEAINSFEFTLNALQSKITSLESLMVSIAKGIDVLPQGHVVISHNVTK